MLLSTTYAALNLVSQATNRTIPLDKKFSPKPKTDPDVAAAAKTSLQDLHDLNLLESSVHTPADLETAKSKLAASRHKYRREVRASLARERDQQDAKLSEILSKNPNDVFRAFKAASKCSAPAVSKMKVGTKVYSGESVPDGIFDSLNQFKAPPMDPNRDSEHYMEAVSTYDHIMKLASCGEKMPLISLADGERLLRGLRTSVMDFFSITSLHFLHLGQQGIFHFVFLLNTIINHINSSSVSELNTIWAIILHKGHNKDPESDRSWRTISCCPLIAKALDTYLVELYGDGWSAVQAPTQFQGSNSSHELAALSITEAINHSIYVNKQPVYLLLLDAKSAFDLVIIEHAIRCAWNAGTQDQGLVYLDKRLRNRLTFVEWDKQMMGPIADTVGVEQGGCYSDRVYRLVNNEQLDTAQKSELGIDLGLAPAPSGGLVRQVLSSVGQADDVGLLSSSLMNLICLLHLTKMYCAKYQVQLVGAKTKLLVFNTKESVHHTAVELAAYPVIVDQPIEPSDEAAHVGVVRSVHGNMAHISERLSAHRKSVYAVLHGGMARGHRANPAASLRVEKVYCVSVLLSGMASLVFTDREMKLMDKHYKVHLERLLKLHQATPAPVVFFLAGCLPLPAQLHQRMFSLFGQLCRLRDGDNILAAHARNILSSSSPSSKSWFWKLRQLCLQYGLPHPLTWLDTRPSKLQVKVQVRSAVLQYWRTKLHTKADSLSSLCYLRTGFMSLTRCHPVFSSCGSSPWEMEKAVTQSRLLSGRYRLEALSGHWTPGNREGLCALPECWGTPASHKGTVEAFLLTCPSLSAVRLELTIATLRFQDDHPHLKEVVNNCMADSPVQFLLDCSTMPIVIEAVQKLGECVLNKLFKLTRNYCHRLHVSRKKLIDA